MLMLTLLASLALYTHDFPSLRDACNWSEIVRQGEEAAAEIHGQLASSYFYQGDYENAKKHALLSKEKEPLHSLYLLSAVARAEGDFLLAKSLALEALPFAAGELKAKILFNLGAACADDPEGDLAEALQCYQEALSLFECPLDRQRTLIRLSKVFLLQGQIEEAERLIQFAPSNDRIAVHAGYLKAQIKQAQGNPDEARRIASEALDQALSLGAKQDAKRIQEFLEKL